MRYVSPSVSRCAPRVKGGAKLLRQSESAADDGITAFGGGSFEDLTRIAMINAPLWTELFMLNKEKLCAHIENFEKEIAAMKKMISGEDASGLVNYLSDVREKRLRMGSIRQVR